VSPDTWQPAGIELEPNALAACTSEGSVAVTAGPGAGKTELLAQRADFLLRTNLCPYPRRILAISFKVDAAANLATRVRARVPPELARRLDSWTFHAFSLRLVRQFRPVLSGADALDRDFTVGDQRVHRQVITFRDFVPLARSVIEASDEVAQGLRHTYSHVFLDEFQDCTENQYQLIRLAFAGSDATLTAVGDTKQRIMGWAGALEGIFERFAEDFDATPLNLYQNFRSAPTLRRMQNRMVAKMEPSAAVDPSELQGADGRIDVIATADADEEARRLVDWIIARIEEGTPESEIAVLFSKQPELYGRQLCQALDDAAIPYRDEVALQDLVKEPIVQLLLDYLQLLTGSHRPRAYLRLVRGSHFASDDEREVFRRRTAWEAQVRTARDELHAHVAGLSDPAVLARLADGLLNFLGRAAVVALHPDYESEDRVTALVSAVVDRVVELTGDGVNPVEALDGFAEERAVRVMTIHKSKGLEFEAVAVVGVEHETFWGKREDERAAYFVGVSRAKSRLLLTHTAHRPWPAGASRWDERRTAHREFLDYAHAGNEIAPPDDA
jgi:superfamily I DNA/RNA helicase